MWQCQHWPSFPPSFSIVQPALHTIRFFAETRNECVCHLAALCSIAPGLAMSLNRGACLNSNSITVLTRNRKIIIGQMKLSCISSGVLPRNHRWMVPSSNVNHMSLFFML